MLKISIISYNVQDYPIKFKPTSQMRKVGPRKGHGSHQIISNNRGTQDFVI